MSAARRPVALGVLAALGACQSAGHGPELRSTLVLPGLDPDAPGLAIRVGRLLTMNARHEVFDPGMILVQDGRVLHAGEPVDVPEGFERLDEEELWAWPGLVDLHTHVHSNGWWDTNDMVRVVNPELRVRPTLDPWNDALPVANAAGVTTLFGIPGSGTSISGFGVLYKTKTAAEGYEDLVLKDPGGMKSAFNFNPQRSEGNLGRTWAGLSWTVETLNDRARAAAEGARPEAPGDWQLADLGRVVTGELPVLIHCASAEGVAGSVRLWKRREGAQAVVSHGSWDGHMAARYAAENDTPVNHGPRILNFRSMVREDKVQGGAQSFVDAGVPDFSLNTDSPVLPQEELFLQGTMSAWLGADAYEMVRALTTNPARSFGIGDRVGSLEPGKDADIVLSSGDPLDPRSRVEWVFIDGTLQYSRREHGQLF